MGEEVWDRVWTKNLITSDYSLKYLAFMQDIEASLPEGSFVLEAGCGTGQTLALLSSRHNTVGLDISRAALNLARNSCKNPVLGSIFEIPFEDNTFDLVYNSGVIEHFVDPTNVNAIREMARVTRPSGKVIIIVPNTLCLWYKAGKTIAVMMKNFEFGYEEDYSPKRLKTAAARAGLVVEKAFGLQALPPLATNDREVVGVDLRRKFGRIESVFPFRQYYAYTVGIIARKPE
ncbi:MAG: methyltransferase domain-containing protein [Methanoregula sp.]|jgi:SAM-dependent methyltransferase|nr:methyltransferase domain-containing protein [Methanoregula sp.]